jgi:hypothetical protein
MIPCGSGSFKRFRGDRAIGCQSGGACPQLVKVRDHGSQPIHSELQAHNPRRLGCVVARARLIQSHEIARA